MKKTLLTTLIAALFAFALPTFAGTDSSKASNDSTAKAEASKGANDQAKADNDKNNNNNDKEDSAAKKVIKLKVIKEAVN